MWLVWTAAATGTRKIASLWATVTEKVDLRRIRVVFERADTGSVQGSLKHHRWFHTKCKTAFYQLLFVCVEFRRRKEEKVHFGRAQQKWNLLLFYFYCRNYTPSYWNFRFFRNRIIQISVFKWKSRKWGENIYICQLNISSWDRIINLLWVKQTANVYQVIFHYDEYKPYLRLLLLLYLLEVGALHLELNREGVPSYFIFLEKVFRN